MVRRTLRYFLAILSSTTTFPSRCVTVNDPSTNRACTWIMPNPPCRKCGASTDRLHCRWYNPNYNAGRPYFICFRCNKFNAFDDERGIHPHNHDCDCQEPSRLCVTNRKKNDLRMLFLTCATGACNYWIPAKCKGSFYVNETQTRSLVEKGIIWYRWELQAQRRYRLSVNVKFRRFVRQARR